MTTLQQLRKKRKPELDDMTRIDSSKLDIESLVDRFDKKSLHFGATLYGRENNVSDKTTAEIVESLKGIRDKLGVV